MRAPSEHDPGRTFVFSFRNLGEFSSRLSAVSIVSYCGFLSLFWGFTKCVCTAGNFFWKFVGSRLPRGRTYSVLAVLKQEWQSPIVDLSCGGRSGFEEFPQPHDRWFLDTSGDAVFHTVTK